MRINKICEGKIEMKKRSGKIDFLKFVFSIVIVLIHANDYILEGTGIVILPTGYLAVEFFFVISSYMMAVSFEKHEKTTYDFIIGKIQKCIPNFYVAWGISFVLFHIYQMPHGIKDIAIDIIEAIPELLLFWMGGIMETIFGSLLVYFSDDYSDAIFIPIVEKI